MVEVILPNGDKLEAHLAKNHAERINGLSGAKEKKNMLFAMPFSFRWGFWMPFMYYPISIIYISKEKEVVDVHNAVPMTYNWKTWKVYKPKKVCKYVLETPFEHNIKIGDKLQF